MPLGMMYGVLQIELHKNKLYCEEYKIYKGYKPFAYYSYNTGNLKNAPF